MATKMIARALNISPGNIGHAGLKDAQAVTRQTLSIDRVTPEAVAALNIPHIKILQVNRHQNKLKIGHLAGNRFVIKVRQVTPGSTACSRVSCSRFTQKRRAQFFRRAALRPSGEYPCPG